MVLPRTRLRVGLGARLRLGLRLRALGLVHLGLRLTVLPRSAALLLLALTRRQDLEHQSVGSSGAAQNCGRVDARIVAHLLLLLLLLLQLRSSDSLRLALAAADD